MRYNNRTILSLLLLLTVYQGVTQQREGEISKNGNAPDVGHIANPELKGNGLKHFLMGRNYRGEWTTAVHAPVINLSGYKIMKEGGGKQTRSLRIKDSNGKEWSLRSVRKYPRKAIDPDLQDTFAEDLVNDGISASYPFASLSAIPLSQAAQVTSLLDSLVFIPDDERLGQYREKYKNTLAFLEEREPSVDSRGNKITETISTNELVQELQKSNTTIVDQQAVLRARLLDNFIMDFDRHEEQWLWYSSDLGIFKVYRPIPKDRDQAFFTNRGLIPYIAREGILPEIQGFRAKAKNIKSFNNTAKNFDHYFLTHLSEADWSQQIDTFLSLMSDSVIDAAMRKQPAEIYNLSAADIAATLKERRNYFKHEMLSYYRFLAKDVTLVGSNESEYFNINNKADSLTVGVFRKDSTGNPAELIYQRSFSDKNTKDIKIYGLENADSFHLAGNKSRMKLHLVGGPGGDKFTSADSGLRAKIYDVRYEENSVTGKAFKNKISSDPQNNAFIRLGFINNRFMKGLDLEYSTDGGIFIGPKLKLTTQGFRKYPYAAQHILAASRALQTNSYHLYYKGHFVNVLHKTDLFISADAKLPTVRTNFYGLGNNTPNVSANPLGREYYHVSYNVVSTSAFLSHSILPWWQLNLGGAFQYYQLRRELNNNKYIATVLPAIYDINTIYDPRYYAGVELSTTWNTRNNDIFPTRGMIVALYVHPLFGLNNYSRNVTSQGGHFSFYLPMFRKQLVFANDLGGEYVSGNFEFQQAATLGFKQNLRGYRIQRFTGRSRAYANTDLRLRLGELKAYIMKGSFGLVGFNDVGRVWSDGETSKTWHDGYGGGIWISPFNKFTISVSLSYSAEEKNLGLINFGFQF